MGTRAACLSRCQYAKEARALLCTSNPAPNVAAVNSTDVRSCTVRADLDSSNRGKALPSGSHVRMSLLPKRILLHLPVVRQAADDPRLLTFARATYSSPLCLRGASASGDLSILATAQSDAQRICYLSQATCVRWVGHSREIPDEGQKRSQDTKVAGFGNSSFGPRACIMSNYPRNGPIDGHAPWALSLEQAKRCGKLLHRQALWHLHDVSMFAFAFGEWKKPSDLRRTRGRLGAAALGIMFQLEMTDLWIGDVLEAQRPTVRQFLQPSPRILPLWAQLAPRAPVSASPESKVATEPLATHTRRDHFATQAMKSMRGAPMITERHILSNRMFT
ncbi:hypothetical protein LZ30DRAFT_239474 [Colletotrichum cereale]|nr:hypothetical protein LZ30DRAFT_239474 [Colletotrichum cereale]